MDLKKFLKKHVGRKRIKTKNLLGKDYHSVKGNFSYELKRALEKEGFKVFDSHFSSSTIYRMTDGTFHIELSYSPSNQTTSIGESGLLPPRNRAARLKLILASEGFDLPKR